MQEDGGRIGHAELAQLLRGPSPSLLIVDCRPFSDFNKGHIRFAVNAFYSKLMRRRLTANKLDADLLVSQLLGNDEQRSKITSYMDVVIYSDCDRDKALRRPSTIGGLKRRHPSDEKVSSCCSNNNNVDDGSETKFIRLLKEKVDDAKVFGSVRTLEGGFTTFRQSFPALTESPSSPSPAPPPPLNRRATLHSPATPNGLPPLRLVPATAVPQPMHSSVPGGSLSQPCLSLPPNGPTRILPHVWLGSQQDALDQEFIKKHDIEYVLNLSIACPRSDAIPDDSDHFLRISVNDSYAEKLLPYFESAFQFLEKVRARNSVALVHCLAGISRSPTICISYIMRHLRLGSDEAYKFVKTLRPGISPNFNFMGQLLDYQSRLREAGILPPKTDEEARAEREAAAAHRAAADAEIDRASPQLGPAVKMPKSASSHAILSSSSRSRIPKEAGVREEDEEIENLEGISTALNENGKRGITVAPQAPPPTLASLSCPAGSSSAPASLTRPDILLAEIQRPKVLFFRSRRGETATSPRAKEELPSPSTELSRLSFDQEMHSKRDAAPSSVIFSSNPCFISPVEPVKMRREECAVQGRAPESRPSHPTSSSNPFFASPTTSDVPSSSSTPSSSSSPSSSRHPTSSPKEGPVSSYLHRLSNAFFKKGSNSDRYSRPDCLEKAGEPHETASSGHFSSSDRSSLGSSVLSASSGLQSSVLSSLPEHSDESGFADSSTDSFRLARDDPERASLGSTSSHEITVN